MNAFFLWSRCRELLDFNIFMICVTLVFQLWHVDQSIANFPSAILYLHRVALGCVLTMQVDMRDLLDG